MRTKLPPFSLYWIMGYRCDEKRSSWFCFRNVSSISYLWLVMAQCWRDVDDGRYTDGLEFHCDYSCGHRGNFRDYLPYRRGIYLACTAASNDSLYRCIGNKEIEMKNEVYWFVTLLLGLLAIMGCGKWLDIDQLVLAHIFTLYSVFGAAGWLIQYLLSLVFKGDWNEK